MASSKRGKLLLFDIDGTLLTSSGIGRRLMDETLEHRFGPLVSCAGIPFSGRTDLEIVTTALRRGGVPEADLAHQVRSTLRAYARRARGRIQAADVQVLPGVRHLLARLRRMAGVQLGLVTGNVRETAYLKLRAAGLAKLFPFGAFGDDHAVRKWLPALAVQRAHAYNGILYHGHDVVVVGDSVLDVRCGHHVGAFAVAVATGLTGREKLALEGPHLLLDDLSDADAFCGAVLVQGQLH